MTSRFAMLGVLASLSSTACEEQPCEDDIEFTLEQPSSEVLITATLDSERRKGQASVGVRLEWMFEDDEAHFESVFSGATFTTRDHHARIELPVRRVDTLEGVAATGEAHISGEAVGGCTVSLELQSP